MPRVSAAFFLTGALFVLFGMTWGAVMGAHEDFATAPAHAHLNLLGWVTLALYGTFYAFTGKTMSPRLAWANYIVSTLGVLVMIPSLALLLAGGNDPAYQPGIAVGGTLNILGAVIFLIAVARELVRKRD